VLPRLAKYALKIAPGVPATVRAKVELLLRDREPFIPTGFDSADQDDRIIADALDFRWTHAGARVIMLSGDYTVRIKARSQGLEEMAVPSELELPSSQPRQDDASSDSPGQT
jgi:predicted ribonuclease YlaK